MLCFRWCLSSYICNSLREAVAEYLRSNGIPTIVRLDGFGYRTAVVHTTVSQRKRLSLPTPLHVSPLPCFTAAAISCCFPSVRLYRRQASFTKGCLEHEAASLQSTSRQLRQARGPPLRHVVEYDLIAFFNPKKLAGKCTSLSVAVPHASLHMSHINRQVASFRRTGGSKVLAPVGAETVWWMEICERMNGAFWYDASHHALTMTHATDASSGIRRDASRALSVPRQSFFHAA